MPRVYPIRPKALCKPCVKCGATERHATRGSCIPCDRARTAKRQADPAKREHDRARLREKYRSHTPEQRADWLARNAAYRAIPENRLRIHMQRRHRKFGITPAEQQALFAAQQGRCANLGCRDTLDFLKAHLDHDHATGQVRGFLCADCNVASGRLKDSPTRARGLAAYLARRAPALAFARVHHEAEPKRITG